MASYSHSVMSRVRQQMGLEDENDTSRDGEIQQMSKLEVFEKCLIWEGILGYDYLITEWVKNIWGVELE
jgi:hypothetical protein